MGTLVPLVPWTSAAHAHVTELVRFYKKKEQDNNKAFELAKSKEEDNEALELAKEQDNAEALELAVEMYKKGRKPHDCLPSAERVTELISELIWLQEAT